MTPEELADAARFEVVNPEQMRALASDRPWTAAEESEWNFQVRAALRAAADQLEAVQAELEDVHVGYRMSSAALDRFRDVVCEVIGFENENPGDDVSLGLLRDRAGKTGPEPTRWREFITAARAQVDQINAKHRRTAESASQDARSGRSAAMTDPVDTDALRAWNAGRSDDKLFPLVADAADEVDRLRAVIENAPHTRGCILRTRRYGGTCDCWKADAL